MKVYWIGLDTPGRLGVSRKPEGGDALDAQMEHLHRGMVDHVVSLLEPAEAAEFGLAEEGEAAQRHGIGFYNFPIVDHGLPGNVDHYVRVARAVDARLRSGQAIVIHCRAGLGRAPSLAICSLVAGGMNVDEAVLRVGRARGRPVPETDEQLAFVQSFAAHLKASA
ncbi:protein-tyrosine phosphatase family protein [Brevundimonas sp.]|uniref:protein-tyrosine phosphatase family protein n=1 Tax=Brevundimonas sp. TaxID=1871086 RepID=UPI003F6FDA57